MKVIDSIMTTNDQRVNNLIMRTGKPHYVWRGDGWIKVISCRIANYGPIVGDGGSGGSWSWP